MKDSNLSVFHIIVSSFCFFISCSLNTFASPARHLCHPDQRDALLDFKNEFGIGKLEFDDFDGYSKTDSWNRSSDCCSWDGVRCDAESGEVIGLDLSGNNLNRPFKSNSSLFRLQHLRSLDLSYNNFSASPIPTEIGKLTGLTRLNLSESSFSGQIPVELLQLTKLVSLDLSSCSSPGLFTPKSFLGELTRNLTSLEELYLTCTDISSTVPPDFVNLSSLRSFHLDLCNLFGDFPSDVFLMPNIQSIVLNTNSNLTGSLPEFHRPSSLVTLDLSFTSFSGRLPDSIGNLESLSYLDLSGCNLSGSIPSSIGNLSRLIHLDISINDLVGEVPSSIGNLNRLTVFIVWGNRLSGNFPFALLNLTELSTIKISTNQFIGSLPSNMSGLSKLESFLASDNSFTGLLPSTLFMIPSLLEVALDRNRLSGQIQFGNMSSPSKLEHLSLGRNNFDGPILRSISKLVQLSGLDLSYSNTGIAIDLSLFSPLKLLYSLDLSGNNVQVTDKSSVPDLPSLGELYLSACNIDELPGFLISKKGLSHLDLSSNKLRGRVPKWLWRLPELQYLNLSNNLFSSFEGSPEVLHETNIDTLDLSSNIFLGPFPSPPPSIETLFVSRNNFSGEIPQSICQLSSAVIIDLSYNNFGGSTPQCLGGLKTLSVLNLGHNNLGGSLPDTFITSNNLRSLDVGHNQLVGKLPRSLINCTRLEVFNVGNNKIHDTFPFWLNSLRELQVLVLRSNELYGSIYLPRASFGFPELRIIDISHNHFIGALPPDYFANWVAMSSIRTEPKTKYMGDILGYYHDSIVLTNKGLDMEYTRILTIFTPIDFSGNRLQGQISESIGSLKELHVLNLSNNAFTGHIPPSLANLTELESLDLSRNKLSGEIPPMLGSLSFLSYMSFSHNQLIGPIPQGQQFRTQPKSTFEDNLGLCGPPLDQSCGETNTPPSQLPESQEPEQDVLSWRAFAIGYSPGVVFGFTIGHIFTSSKYQWFRRRRTTAR